MSELDITTPSTAKGIIETSTEIHTQNIGNEIKRHFNNLVGIIQQNQATALIVGGILAFMIFRK